MDYIDYYFDLLLRLLLTRGNKKEPTPCCAPRLGPKGPAARQPQSARACQETAKVEAKPRPSGFIVPFK